MRKRKSSTLLTRNLQKLQQSRLVFSNWHMLLRPPNFQKVQPNSLGKKHWHEPELCNIVWLVTGDHGSEKMFETLIGDVIYTFGITKSSTIIGWIRKLQWTIRSQFLCQKFFLVNGNWAQTKKTSIKFCMLHTFQFSTPVTNFKVLNEAYIEELFINDTTGKDRILRTSLLFFIVVLHSLLTVIGDFNKHRDGKIEVCS